MIYFNEEIKNTLIIKGGANYEREKRDTHCGKQGSCLLEIKRRNDVE